MRPGTRRWSSAGSGWRRNGATSTTCPARASRCRWRGPDDENWWVRGYLRREGLSAEPLLPTPLQLRREVERLPETVADLRDEQAVRDVARALNRRIAEWLRAPVGPAVPIGPVDVNAVVARWRTDRAALPSAGPPSAGAADAAARPPGTRARWRRQTARTPRRHRDGQRGRAR